MSEHNRLRNTDENFDEEVPVEEATNQLDSGPSVRVVEDAETGGFEICDRQNKEAYIFSTMSVTPRLWK